MKKQNSGKYDQLVGIPVNDQGDVSWLLDITGKVKLIQHTIEGEVEKELTFQEGCGYSRKVEVVLDKKEETKLN